MKREEQKEKLYFLQVSEKFFSELPVRRLLRASGGDTMLRIYLQAHCVALRTGGVLELHEDMEPAEEIGILIGASAIETPIIAATMQHCLAYGLISTSEGEGEGKIINFSLTADYTRAWTKDAIERREKREAERLGAEAPQIEEKTGTEADKPGEKEDPIDYTAIRNAWNRMAESTGLDQVIRITDKRRAHIRARVREYSFDQCLRAIDLVGESAFLCGKVPPKDGKPPFKADLAWVFKNSENFTKILEGKYKDKTQPAQPTKEIITDAMVQAEIDQQGLYIYGSGYDMALWDQIKGKYSTEMQAAIEQAIKQ